jgi:hypothetical protein
MTRTAPLQTPAKLAVLSRDKQLSLLHFPSLELDSVLARFTLEGGHVSCATQVASNSEHAWVAACAEYVELPCPFV